MNYHRNSFKRLLTGVSVSSLTPSQSHSPSFQKHLLKIKKKKSTLLFLSLKSVIPHCLQNKTKKCTILPHSTDTLPHLSPDPASNLLEQQIACTFLTNRLLISKTLCILILITEGQYILLVCGYKMHPLSIFNQLKILIIL